MAAGSTYTPIATTTLGSAAATINFTSISGSYTDLRVVLNFTCSTSNSIRAQYNADTGTNYSQTLLFGNGTSATTSNSTNINYVFITNGSSTTIPDMATLDIFSYANTNTYKTSLSSQARSAAVVGKSVQLWRSTAAITSISFFLSSGNFATGTTATLYGIRAA